MKIIVCLDKNNGIRFNMRRQSRDREVIADIEKMYSKKKIWMNEYSKELFEGYPKLNICVDEKYLSKATSEDYCFVESDIVNNYMKNVDEIIVYRWDKVYPQDEKIDMDGYKISIREEIKGYSHDLIVKEIYIRQL